MKLPNADRAVVEREKLADYLLNPAHPDNGGKAEFFLALGFRREDWAKLAAALCSLAVVSPVLKSVASPHGCKYVLDGRIELPTGKSPKIRTVWIVDRGGEAPRLVTAYPQEE